MNRIEPTDENDELDAIDEPNPEADACFARAVTIQNRSAELVHRLVQEVEPTDLRARALLYATVRALIVSACEVGHEQSVKQLTLAGNMLGVEALVGVYGAAKEMGRNVEGAWRPKTEGGQN